MAHYRQATSFRSCCRLCMVETSGILKNIYARNDSDSLSDKIYAVTGIKITATDRISTYLCDKCNVIIADFNDFKTNCWKSQQELKRRLVDFETFLLNDSIQIKDEPLSDDDEVVFISTTDQPFVKREQSLLQVAVDHIDNDQPPLLSPNLPTTTDLLRNLLVSDSDDDSMDAHDSPIQPPQQSAVEIPGPERENPEAQRDKIDFAAGLQLQSRNNSATSGAAPAAAMVVDDDGTTTTSMSKQPITKAELNYIKKMSVIYFQSKDLMCYCHNRSYPHRNSLNNHLRSRGVMPPPYTCINCLTTFTGPSTHQKHLHVRCYGELELFPLLLDGKERDTNKHRLYHIFNCGLCHSDYRLFEVYEQHLLIVHSNASTKQCRCGKKFDTDDDFHRHLLSPCCLHHKCDLCQTSFGSLEAFKSHCADGHDKHPGKSIQLAKGVQLKELPQFVKYACADCNFKCLDQANLKNHLATKHNYDHGKRMLNGDHTPMIIENGDHDHEKHINMNNNSFPVPEPMSKSLMESSASPSGDLLVLQQPRLSAGMLECEICMKIFSSRSNLARHQYQVHLRYKKTDNVKQRNFRCGDCDATFADVAALSEHLNSEHFFTCSDCGRKCKSVDELNLHRASHLKISLTRDPNTKSYRSNSRCARCDVSFQTEEEYNEHMNAHDDKMPTLESVEQIDLKSLKVECKLCKRLFATTHGLSIHISRSHPEVTIHRDKLQNFPRACSKCGLCINNLNAWSIHMRMHGQDSSSSSPANTEEDTDYFTCKKCFKVFSSRGNLRQHMRTHTSPSKVKPVVKTLCCAICKEQCADLAEFNKHKQTHVAKIISGVHCKYCKVIFADFNMLATHMKEEHEENYNEKTAKRAKFECKICGKKCPTADSLRGHTGWHTKQRNLGHFEGHTRSSPPKLKLIADPDVEEPPKVKINTSGKLNLGNKSKSYVCITCGNLFPHQPDLHAHITSVHRKIRCIVCSEYFSEADFKDHQKMHQAAKNVKTIECDICLEDLNSDAELLQHIEEVHKTPNSKHKCPHCPQTFMRKAGLLSHLRRHSRQQEKLLEKKIQTIKERDRLSEKPSKSEKCLLKCGICGEGFNLGPDLRSHIIAQHPF